MRNHLVMLAVFASFAALLAGCISTRRGATTGRDLVGLDEQWAAAAEKGDIEKIMGYWTEDAVLYAPNLPPLYGTKAIREMIEGRRTNPAYRIAWTPSCAGVDEHGAMAYTLGRGTVSLVDDSGTLRELRGRYVAIWRKDGGRWRCAVKSWTPTSPERP